MNTEATVRVAYIGSAIASYRMGFYRRTCADPTVRLTVFCQNRFPSQNLKLIHDKLDCEVVTLPFVGREDRLVLQWLPVLRLWRESDVFVFYGNPRILTNVLWSLLFHWLGKPVVLVGHAHTALANPWTERLHRWWSLFKTLLVYNDREVDYLRQRGFARQTLVAWNNGLDQNNIDREAAEWTPERLRDWQQQQRLEGKQVVLSVARLVDKNNFQLVIHALPDLIQEFPQISWCVIGDGPMRQRLEQQAKELQVESHVRWVGPIYGEAELAPWFLSSLCLVHPGAVGLTLLHAFGYAVPVITNNDYQNQMPEIAAFRDGENGLAFSPDNRSELCGALRSILRVPTTARQMGMAGRKLVREEFNTDVMADRFLGMIHDVAKSRGK